MTKYIAQTEKHAWDLGIKLGVSRILNAPVTYSPIPLLVYSFNRGLRIYSMSKSLSLSLTFE